MFSVFKVLYPTSTNNEVTYQVKGFSYKSCGCSDQVAPPVSMRMRAQGNDTKAQTKMNLKYFQMFSCIAYKCFCKKLNCTYWALAHIVHVVGTAGKQPTT